MRCFLGIHNYQDTTRDVLTFDNNGNIIGAKAPTCRCSRCGKFKNPAFDIEQGFLAATTVKR